MRKHLGLLDISVGISEPHDFTVRAPRRSSVRQVRVHRIPRPTSVTIAIRPSWRVRDGAGCKGDLGLRRSNLFLRAGLDNISADLPVGQNWGPLFPCPTSLREM